MQNDSFIFQMLDQLCFSPHHLLLVQFCLWQGDRDLDLKAQMIVLRDVRATVDAAINLRVLLRPRIDDERCLRVVRADLGAQWLEAIRPSLDAVVRARGVRGIVGRAAA